MFVHYEVITATLPGTRRKHAECEQCGTHFQYDLSRIGTGRGLAFFWLFRNAARGRASRAAAKDLEKRLGREEDMVPCPACGWINVESIRQYRNSRYRWMRVPILVLSIFAGAVVILSVWMVIDFIGPRTRKSPVDWQAWAFALGVPAALLALPIGLGTIRGWLRRRFDPNRFFPAPPLVLPGTPPALEEQTGAGGQPVLVPVRAEVLADPSVEGWAICHAGQLNLPPQCCLCLQPATTHYAPPIRTNERNDLNVPICEACQRKCRARWWRTVVGVTIATIAAGAIGGDVTPKIDDIGRWFLYVFAAGFGAVLGIVLANVRAKPYAIRFVDQKRGVLKFRSDSPAYTRLVADQLATRETRIDASRAEV